MPRVQLTAVANRHMPLQCSPSSKRAWRLQPNISRSDGCETSKAASTQCEWGASRSNAEKCDIACVCVPPNVPPIPCVHNVLCIKCVLRACQPNFYNTVSIVLRHACWCCCCCMPCNLYTLATCT